MKSVLAAGTVMSIGLGSAGYGLAQTGEGPGLAIDSQAQSLFDRGRNVSVMQRPREEYTPRGLRTGAFLAYPKVTVEAESNDNIYARQVNRTDDVIIRTTPEMNVFSQFSNHALNAYARAVINKYLDNDDENTTDYAVGANGRLDIRRSTALNGGIDFSRNTEPRGSPNNPGANAEPVRYDLRSLNVGLRHDFNRLRLEARYANRRYNYDDVPLFGGGITDQDFRDRTVHVYTGRADYALSPDTAVFFEVSGNKRDYRTTPAGRINRSSDGVQGLVGANFDLTATMRGELAVGYLKQEYDDPTLDDLKGFGARALVEWFPSGLTTVTFGARRSVEDSALAGIGGYLSSNVDARVDHELMRNLILTARANYGQDNYKELARKDERVGAGVSMTYFINRNLGLKAGYSYERSADIKGFGNDFITNKVTAGLTFQF